MILIIEEKCPQEVLGIKKELIKINKKLNSQSGQAIIIVVAVISISSLLIIGLNSYILSHIEYSNAERRIQRSEELAEIGLQELVHKINIDIENNELDLTEGEKQLQGELTSQTFASGNYEVVLEEINKENNMHRFISKGVVEKGFDNEIKSKLEAEIIINNSIPNREYVLVRSEEIL